MSRHQKYSKRSRESRKAMTDGTADDDDVDDDYAGCCEPVAEDWPPAVEEGSPPPDPAR